MFFDFPGSAIHFDRFTPKRPRATIAAVHAFLIGIDLVSAGIRPGIESREQDIFVSVEQVASVRNGGGICKRL